MTALKEGEETVVECFEANCSKQMGQHKKTFFHQIPLCLHEGRQNDAVLFVPHVTEFWGGEGYTGVTMTACLGFVQKISSEPLNLL